MKYKYHETQAAPYAQWNTDMQAPAPSPWTLFIAFTQLSMQGFGGVLAVAQRELVERRGWLNSAEFVELLAVSQVLPGPNICNISVLIGHRFAGVRGAVAALAGMLLLPLLLILVLAMLYSRFSALTPVAGALRGMGAVAAGLMIGMAAKLSATLRHNALGWPISAIFVVVIFVLIAGLRWPLAWVLLGLGLPACLLATQRLRRLAATQQDRRIP